MSPAKRYTLRLYRHGMLQAERQENFDHRDDRRLRELLEALVKAKRGTLNLDLSQWRMEVWDVTGGPRYARVSVDESGRTVVKR